MHFDVRGISSKSTRDRTLSKVLKSPAIMGSGISNIKFLSSDSDELCDKLKLLLQKKHARNNSDLFNKEIFPILDTLLENKCFLKKNIIKL